MLFEFRLSCHKKFFWMLYYCKKSMKNIHNFTVLIILYGNVYNYWARLVCTSIILSITFDVSYTILYLKLCLNYQF